MDAGESDSVKKDSSGGGGKKGQPSDQKHGKKGGKGERQKGKEKAKDSHPSWVKKDADDSEEEQRPHERERGKGRDKAREKGEKGSGKDGRGEGRKENWKERRGKQHDRYDGDSAATGGNDASGGDGRQRGNAENAEALNGGALLSLLKSHTPSVRRYTREELFSIGQLAASKVKPDMLSEIIDKENAASPLLVRPKVPRRNREGEEEDYDEEAAAGRRERRQRARRGDLEEEEEEEVDRRRTRRWDQREQDRGWKQEEQQPKGKGFGKGKGYDEDGYGDGAGYRQYEDQWTAPPVKSSRGDEWEMPDVSESQNASLMDFTLGDIRKAERSINKGMSMSDYIKNTRADQHHAAASKPSRPVEETRGSSGKDRSGKDSSLNSSSGFFVEEDEDVAQASRGFGKWFGRGVETGGKGMDDSNEEEADDLWDMPDMQATGPLAGLPPGMLQAGLSKPSPSSSSQNRAEPRSPEAHPYGLSSIERLLEESPSSKRDVDGRPGEDDSGPIAPDKSILSMLGRPEGERDAQGSNAAAADQAKQGKLSVAELFHLAQGKELPSMPKATSLQKDDGDESAKQKMQALEAMMWQQMQAAAKAGMPSGSRFPGLVPTPPYGAVPPNVNTFGLKGPGVAGAAAMMGRGTTQEQLYAQAQAAQAAQAALLGAGRGGFPAGGRGAKGAQASWPSVGAGYPFPGSRGYGSQGYGGYPAADFLSRGAGGFDGSSAQGFNAQAAAMQGMYNGIGASEGTWGAAKSSTPSPEKAAIRAPASQVAQASPWTDSANANVAGAGLVQASALIGTIATAGVPGLVTPASVDGGGTAAVGLGQEEDKDDAGCSQS